MQFENMNYKISKTKIYSSCSSGKVHHPNHEINIRSINICIICQISATCLLLEGQIICIMEDETKTIQVL